jgi:hypothetical protein
VISGTPKQAIAHSRAGKSQGGGVLTAGPAGPDAAAVWQLAVDSRAVPSHEMGEIGPATAVDARTVVQIITTARPGRELIGVKASTKDPPGA